MQPESHNPITASMPDLSRWASDLESIARRPLSFLDAFPDVARRHEAWWSQSLDNHPLFLGQTNGAPSRPINRRLELLSDAEAWFEAKLADVAQMHRVGDALPAVRIDFGPCALGCLCGACVEFGGDTAWTHPMIDDDWSNVPDFLLQHDNPWWIKLHALLDRVAADALDRYVVCTPDLGGSADVLLNLRGATELCMDALERPDRVREAIETMFPAWHEAFCALYARTVPRGAGLVHWLGLWSNRPYLVPACDFNFMIGPQEFERICLPDIERQVATVGRAVFHLDGPGATRHVDALLEIEHIRAIQFTPGAGTPSVLPWTAMLRRIQDKGRSILVVCPPEEVLQLCAEVRPESLAIMMEKPPLSEELDVLYDQLRRKYE